MDAFEDLYHTYHARLSRFLLKLIHRPQMVEEVLNDTLLVVWERAEERKSLDATPEEELGFDRCRLLLMKAIAQLSPEHRAVVDFTYFHDMGYREIASIMGCPVDTVKTRMFYARRHLKRRLAGELPDWL
jgi:RNA polymerase sigma-70 factor (ECF subfamily)